MTLLLLLLPPIPLPVMAAAAACTAPAPAPAAFPAPFLQFKQYLQDAVKKKWVASKPRKSAAAQAAQQAMQQEAAAIEAAPADIKKHLKKGKGAAQEPYVYFATVRLCQPLLTALPGQASFFVQHNQEWSLPQACAKEAMHVPCRSGVSSCSRAAAHCSVHC